jgi:hypothetical protein
VDREPWTHGAPPRSVRTGVEPLGGGLFRLTLEGVLSPGWIANLASGLAGRQLAIVRGRARAARGGCWTASFEVLRAREAPDPASLDLVTLARSDARAGFATPVRLERFRLESVREHEGALHLVLVARDAVGFLAALLRRLAYFSIFPAELRLETEGQRVHDELWLRAGGQRAPSTSTREALAHALGALVDD